jgi:tripartite-type tricarboxylate transporter receptor subunit TctC
MRSLPALIAAVFSVTALSPNPAVSQAYPSRPITIVVPFAAGGPLDTLARTISQRLGAELGQSVIIENQPGAGGSTGVGRVVRAGADGYTLCLGNWSTHVINASVYNLSYDLTKDLTPLALLTSNPQLIVGRKSLPAKTLTELIAWLQENNANVGSAGVGSASHASGLFLEQRTHAKLAFVHYQGGGPALRDVLAGHVDLMFDQVSTSLPYVQDGQLKAFAVTAEHRLAIAPGIPTVDEAGLPGFYISVWNGVWAPKGTPTDITARLAAAFSRALDDEAVVNKLTALGQQIPDKMNRSPEALSALQLAELAKWSPIISSAKFK